MKLSKYDGLLHGGGFYLLGIQALGVLCISFWSAFTTFVFLKVFVSISLGVLCARTCHAFAVWMMRGNAQIVNLVIPIRMKPYEEILGADFVEHNIRHVGIDYDGIMKALESRGHVIKEPWCHSIHPELEVPHTATVFDLSSIFDQTNFISNWRVPINIVAILLPKNWAQMNQAWCHMLMLYLLSEDCEGCSISHLINIIASSFLVSVISLRHRYFFVESRGSRVKGVCPQCDFGS